MTGYGGDLTVNASGSGGDVLLDGVIESTGGEGGGVDIDADDDVGLGDIDTTGSSAEGGSGGPIQVTAGGDIDVTGRLASRAVGASGEGADQYLTAGIGIHVQSGAVVDVSSSGADSLTGILLWDAFGGDILFEGQLIGTTPSSLESTDAAFLYANASGSITIDGTMNMGAGNNGTAYESQFQAGGDITVGPDGWIKGDSRSAGGLGGGLDLQADGHVSIQGDLDISGGGQGTGTIEITAGLTATIDARLKATAKNGGSAGAIEITACDVTIADTAKLEANSGSTGTTMLSGGRRVAILGQIKAGLANRVAYDLNSPELLGSISPTATISQTADGSTCGALATCGDGFVDVGEQCDDGNASDGDYCSTGLVWELKTGTVGSSVACTDIVTCPDPHDVNGRYTWSTGAPWSFDGTAKAVFIDVLNDVAGRGSSCFAGHCDWRLPPSRQIETILEPLYPDCVHAPCTTIPGAVATPQYWSGSSHHLWSDHAIQGDFDRGWASYRGKTVDIHVRAVRSTCGNGAIDIAESCDDSNTIDGDGCDSNCRTTGCSNEIVTAGEKCDDGNLRDGDGCESDCTLP